MKHRISYQAVGKLDTTNKSAAEIEQAMEQIEKKFEDEYVEKKENLKAETTQKIQDIMDRFEEDSKKETTRTVEEKKEQRRATDIMDDIRDRLRGFSRTIPSFIMGYFIDVSEELERMNANYRIEKIDKVFGVMTIKAFLNTLVDYSVQRDEAGIDYGLILLREVNYGRIVRDYGQPFANRVLREIADTIVSMTGQNCAVSRVKDADFELLTHAGSSRELEIIAGQLKERIEAIRVVDGNSITLRIRSAARHRSEEGMTDMNICSEVLKSLN